jgi:hypothetical protein
LAVLIALLVGSGPFSKRDAQSGKELSPKESIFLPMCPGRSDARFAPSAF